MLYIEIEECTYLKTCTCNSHPITSECIPMLQPRDRVELIIIGDPWDKINK